ncbi:MAG: energy transducer TonB [Candidatus Sulfotelmatobacter sp.]
MFEQKIFEEKTFDEKDFAQKFATQTLTPKSERVLSSGPRTRTPEDPKQRSLMLAALGLLMVALCFVLYRDRDFWFGDQQEAQMEEPAATAPVAAAPVRPDPITSEPITSDRISSNPVASAPIASKSLPAPVIKPKHHSAASTAKASTRTAIVAQVEPAVAADPPPAVISNRTVLPPLNVEVVAGDTHRTIRPGSNSIRLDLQPGAKPQTVTQPTTEIPDTTASTEAPETAATVTSNAAERVQMSANTEEVVSHPAKPGYPLLARQMKVQGSVIMRALIGKDGMIQDLHVLSGPRILASAAQDAVRQWHFKPHYVGDEAVETQANITVNFTISTN